MLGWHERAKGCFFLSALTWPMGKMCQGLSSEQNRSSFPIPHLLPTGSREKEICGDHVESMPQLLNSTENLLTRESY